MKKEDVMRRISAAIDSADGLTGDPTLQDELRTDPESAKYAKDVTRIGKWLATWPLPEPDDAAFESLAQRIEQRFDESLSAMSDPTAAPVFDDDDALRDATARLLNSGEFPLSDSSIELISDPSSPGLAAAAEAPPSDANAPSPIAKVTLSKARVPTIVEESSGSGEPLSAAELELRLEAKPKKKNIGPAEPGTPAPKKKKKKPVTASTSSSDRISIPTPKAARSAPTLSPVVHLPRADERKPAATFWWFAAAATVGLGVFGAATLFESSQASPSASVHGSTLVTTGALQPTPPAAVAEAPQLGVPVMPSAPPPPADLEADEHETARPMPPPATMALGPVAAHAHYADGTPSTAPPMAPARVTAATGRAASAPEETARADDMVGGALGGGTRRRSAGGGGASPEGASPTPTTATATVTTAEPSPAREERAPAAHAAAPIADPSTLPDTPDRSTIQAVLAARTTAVTACAAGAHGLADVDVVISSSGRITTATVNGSFAGTPIGSCIARAVRGATFPPFSQPRFEVSYPYHL